MSGRTAPVQLRPFVSAGEVLIRPDGRGYDVVPISVFRTSGGQTAIRIGRNVLVFDEDGTYDGPEGSSVPGALSAAELKNAYETAAQNVGRRPADAYYDPGSRGHTAETAIWPPAERPGN